MDKHDVIFPRELIRLRMSTNNNNGNAPLQLSPMSLRMSLRIISVTDVKTLSTRAVSVAVVRWG